MGHLVIYNLTRGGSRISRGGGGAWTRFGGAWTYDAGTFLVKMHVKKELGDFGVGGGRAPENFGM